MVKFANSFCHNFGVNLRQIILTQVKHEHFSTAWSQGDFGEDSFPLTFADVDVPQLHVQEAGLQHGAGEHRGLHLRAVAAAEVQTGLGGLLQHGLQLGGGHLQRGAGTHAGLELELTLPRKHNFSTKYEQSRTRYHIIIVYII